MAKSSRAPVNELFLALFSIFLAFVVWVIVRQQEIVTQTILVPVVVTSPPAFVELSPEVPFEPASVPVTFSFPMGDERLASASEYRLVIDASELADRVSSTETFSRHSIIASRNDLRFPSQLTFVEFVESPEITFRVRLRTAEVEVRHQVVDSRPASGHRVIREEIAVEPERITVAVDEARQVLSREQPLSILTEPVDPVGQNRSIRRVVGLLFDSEGGLYPLPDRPSPTVQVYVPITEIEETRVYEDIPIRFGTIRRSVSARLWPEEADVIVLGPIGLLNRLTPEMIRVTPLPNEFIDEEAVGEPFTTSLEVSFDAPDPEFSQRLRAEASPSIVRIQFYEVTEPVEPVEPEAEEPETVEPEEPEAEEPEPAEEVREDEPSAERAPREGVRTEEPDEPAEEAEPEVDEEETPEPEVEEEAQEEAAEEPVEEVLPEDEPADEVEESEELTEEETASEEAVEAEESEAETTESAEPEPNGEPEVEATEEAAPEDAPQAADPESDDSPTTSPQAGSAA